MKWNRLLAGAVCASLLSVPVWAVEGGEAPAAGAGQTSSTASGVTLDGVCPVSYTQLTLPTIRLV